MITLNDYLTSSCKYPDRARHKECTTEVKANAEQLLIKVNKLLKELGFTKVKVSSGFRPSTVNSAISGAKKSLHMIGKAIDIADPDGKLDKAISEKPELLTTYGLWLEHPDSTVGWAHLDTGSRFERKIRIFKP